MDEFGPNAIGEFGAPAGSEHVSIEPNPTPERQEQLKNQWMQILSQPQVQSGLLQFGLQAMQPLAPGQTQLGHFGQALGGGVAASGRVQTQLEAAEQQDLENARADRTLDLREAEEGGRNSRLDKTIQGELNVAGIRGEYSKIVAKIQAGRDLSEADMKQLGVQSKAEATLFTKIIEDGMKDIRVGIGVTVKKGEDDDKARTRAIKELFDSARQAILHLRGTGGPDPVHTLPRRADGTGSSSIVAPAAPTSIAISGGREVPADAIRQAAKNNAYYQRIIQDGSLTEEDRQAFRIAVEKARIEERRKLQQNQPPAPTGITSTGS